MLLAPGFYSHDDFAEKLGITSEELTKLVKDKKVRCTVVSRKQVQYWIYEEVLIERLREEYGT